MLKSGFTSPILPGGGQIQPAQKRKRSHEEVPPVGSRARFRPGCLAADYRRQQRGRSSDGYPNLGGSFDLRQTALNAGFADGARAGREDRSRRRGYNVQAHSEYQRATRDYNSGRGDRYLYQQYYRVAFEHGYADGYSGY